MLNVCLSIGSEGPQQILGDNAPFPTRPNNSWGSPQSKFMVALELEEEMRGPLKPRKKGHFKKYPSI